MGHDGGWAGNTGSALNEREWSTTAGDPELRYGDACVPINKRGNKKNESANRRRTIVVRRISAWASYHIRQVMISSHPASIARSRQSDHATFGADAIPSVIAMHSFFKPGLNGICQCVVN